MVFTKSRLTISEYLFEPDKDYLLNYSGPHPERLYNYIFDLLKYSLNLPDTHVHEISYSWEIKDGAEKFTIKWRAVLDYDIFSFLRVDVALKGYTKDGKGYASIKVKPRFITEYPQDNIFQQSILYEIIRSIWDNLVYSKKREGWKMESRALVSEFLEKLKKYMAELRHS